MVSDRLNVSNKEFDGTPFLMKDWSIAAESINQLQKDLDAAREAQRYAESQQEAGYRVLTRSHEERDKLKAENQQQAQEIESLKAHLALSQEENKRLKDGMFGECKLAYQYIDCTHDTSFINNAMPLCSSPHRTPRRGGQLFRTGPAEGADRRS
jgi:hypothetical protein